MLLAHVQYIITAVEWSKEYKKLRGEFTMHRLNNQFNSHTEGLLSALLYIVNKDINNHTPFSNRIDPSSNLDNMSAALLFS